MLRPKLFYEKLGFTMMGGDAAQGWLMLRHGDTVLGLFQGMFKKNMLTFNPGWSQGAEALSDFDDIRAIQKHLKEQGLKIDVEADDGGTGPASIILHDPDGNPVMLDQHIGKPAP